MKDVDVETLLLRGFCTPEIVRKEEEEIGNSDHIKELFRVAMSVE